MKKQLFLFVFTIFLLFPAVCFSAYLINLKNGASILTNHYWEENGQIKLYRYGGLVGLPKSAVKGIEKTSKTYVEPADNIQVVGSDAAEKAGAEVKAGPDGKQQEPEASGKEGKKATPGEGEIVEQEVFKQDQQILDDMKTLGEKANFINLLSIPELEKYLAELFKLKKEIVNNPQKALAHPDEINEVVGLIDKVQEAIQKKQNQS